MVFGSKIVGATYDILCIINATVWSGVEEIKKVRKIVKTGVSAADVVVGTSNVLENFGCNDVVCVNLDVIGSVSSAVGIVLGNILAIKNLTLVTGSMIVKCRLVRYYCKKYGTFWGCTVAAG